jgi:hypothetical protein
LVSRRIVRDLAVRAHILSSNPLCSHASIGAAVEGHTAQPSGEGKAGSGNAQISREGMGRILRITMKLTTKVTHVPGVPKISSNRDSINHRPTKA